MRRSKEQQAGMDERHPSGGQIDEIIFRHERGHCFDGRSPRLRLYLNTVQNAPVYTSPNS
jgi:hypothetical protein